MKPQMVWRSLSQISPNLVHAVVLAEDDTFYQHHGFDFEQIQIALAENLQKQKIRLRRQHDHPAAGPDALPQAAQKHSAQIEGSDADGLSGGYPVEKRILELYLNVVEWGPGIFGAEAAAQYYFWKPASELTPDEAVAMASILPSPRRWSPFSEKAFMARRRTQLIERMQKAGYAPVTFLDGDQASTLPIDLNALAEPPHPVAPDPESPDPAPPATPTN